VFRALLPRQPGLEVGGTRIGDAVRDAAQDFVEARGDQRLRLRAGGDGDRVPGHVRPRPSVRAEGPAEQVEEAIAEPFEEGEEGSGIITIGGSGDVTRVVEDEGRTVRRDRLRPAPQRRQLAALQIKLGKAPGARLGGQQVVDCGEGYGDPLRLRGHRIGTRLQCAVGIGVADPEEGRLAGPIRQRDAMDGELRHATPLPVQP
jgi:hypothetical protein